MKKFKSLSLAVLLAVLGGCVIVTDRNEYDDSTDSSSWKRQQRQNRETIADLQLGAGVDEVKTALGSPDFSESLRSDGRQYLILRYRTQHLKSDGKTSLDETTPLVFEDGLLTGWGESAMNSYGL